MNVLDKATTVAETKYVYDKLQEEIDIIAGTVEVESWADAQKIVRAGMASKIFSIGDQLTCQRGNDTLVWDIIGIDQDTPADPQLTHSLTLQLHDCFPTILQFDASEAFYYAENGLAAGTYHFTIDSTDYQFTLASDVAAGGQLILSFTGSTPTSISVSATVGGAVSGEPVSVTAGSDGSELMGVNDINRTRYGSNNYKESAIRQWLNSSAAAGSVWTPQTDFDRPPSWAANTAGFLNGMDADFLAVIGNTTKISLRNAITDGGSYDTLTDKIFLLSTSEIYMGNETANVNEGEPYRYYSDYSDLSAPSATADSNRIKHCNGVAQSWFCRTPVYDAGSTLRGVTESGARKVYLGYFAYGGYGIVPACNII